MLLHNVPTAAQKVDLLRDWWFHPDVQLIEDSSGTSGNRD